MPESTPKDTSVKPSNESKYYALGQRHGHLIGKAYAAVSRLFAKRY